MTTPDWADEVARSMGDCPGLEIATALRKARASGMQEAADILSHRYTVLAKPPHLNDLVARFIPHIVDWAKGNENIIRARADAIENDHH